MDAWILGITFSILTMIFYGLSNAISKKPISEIGPRKAILFRNLFISFILLSIIVLNKEQINFQQEYVFMTFVLSIIGYFSLKSFFRALKDGDVGIDSPITNTSLIITVILSIIFYKESLSLLQYIGIFAVFIGISLISLNLKDLKNSRLFNKNSGIPFALITAILWGTLYFIIKIPAEKIGPALTIFIIEFGIFLCSLCENLYFKTNLSEISKKNILLLFLVALTGAFGGLLFNKAILLIPVSIANAISFSNPLVAVIYGKIVYKETLTKNQYLAIFLILTGVIFVSLF